MGAAVTVSDLPVSELLARICSAAASPGAGAAAAVALALAAACMGKAVSITLKHRPGDADLRSALSTLQLIAREALVDGDRDTQAFKDFVRDRDAPAVEELLDEEEAFGSLIGRMAAVIAEVAPRIQPNMAGDVVAGRALLAAARQIQQRNVAETLSLR
jgi:Formiminotransferase-cyclodeaminase